MPEGRVFVKRHFTADQPVQARIAIFALDIKNSVR